MKYFKVEVFIPEDYVVEFANRLNEEGLLKDGNYDYVFATSKVRGHFRPIEGSSPFIGEIGQVCEVDEIKIEFRIKSCDLDKLKDIVEVVHPYEEPVVNIIELI